MSDVCYLCVELEECPYLDNIDGEWFNLCEQCHNDYYIDASIKI